MLPSFRSFSYGAEAICSACVATLLVVLLLGPVHQAAAQEVPADTARSWEALRARPYPPWFTDAKLGIFIHWGVYSVPAYSGKEDYGEWYLRGLQTGDSLRTAFMREEFGPEFTYYDFAPLFKARLFDPAEWADLFARAGARYVVLVSKHHDGYTLWPSAYAPDWNSVDVGPERDLVGELTDAVRATGLRMGLYYSLSEWNHPLHRWYTDPNEQVGPYVEQHMIPQFRELIDRYEPVVLFSDGEWFNSAEEWHARELIDWYYRRVGPDAVVNDRWGDGADIGFLTPEYSAGLVETARPWAEVRGLGRSFALNRNEKLGAYLTAEELIHFFVGTVAAGGGMILNVGPTADGQIPLLQQERLIQLGRWLDVNGEAIYGARSWQRVGEEREVTLRRTDPAVDFNWVRNTPGAPIREDQFTATWTGTLTPRHSEVYTFEAEADDGIRVWVDEQLVVDQWEGEGSGTAGDVMESEMGASANGTARLEAGQKVPLRVEYREDDLNASARLFWQSPSQAREIVPQAVLSTQADGRTVPGLSAVYRSMQRYLVYTQNNGHLYAITLEWPAGDELVLPVDAPPPGTRVRMLGRDEPLSWRYADGAVRVDLSDVSYDEMPTPWAWTFVVEDYISASE